VEKLKYLGTERIAQKVYNIRIQWRNIMMQDDKIEKVVVEE
jgi:hypothetical protein